MECNAATILSTNYKKRKKKKISFVYLQDSFWRKKLGSNS